MSVLYLILGIVLCNRIVEYRFGYNYGTKFKDYSGNDRFGTSEGLLSTDRGVYFSGTSKGIIIPKFDFPEIVSIIFWVLTKSGGQI